MPLRTRLERIPYEGWPNALRLTNGDVELVVTLDVGPRILRYAPVGGPNALGTLAGDAGGTAEATFRLRGGHRLWVSPEDPARTYVPDNAPVKEEPAPTGVRLTTPADTRFRLEKSVEITLEDSGSLVTLRHRVRNLAEAPTDVAAWALTVMAPRGTAIVPLPARGRHPGSGEATAADYAPSFTMALWPYFSFDDSRLAFGRRFLRLRHEPGRSSTKLGLALRPRWAAYHHESGGLLFLKRFDFHEDAVYPDGGCSFECYADGDILELESLSPLTALAPGAEIEHVETWTLHTDIPAPVDEDTIAAHVLPRLELHPIP